MAFGGITGLLFADNGRLRGFKRLRRQHTGNFRQYFRLNRYAQQFGNCGQYAIERRAVFRFGGLCRLAVPALDKIAARTKLAQRNAVYSWIFLIHFTPSIG